MELFYRSIFAIPSIFFMGRSLQKLFSPQPRRWKRLAVYCLLYATFTLPCWLGDENPIFMFPIFMLTFFVLLQGPKLPKLVCGGILYTLFISLNALFDSLFRDDFIFIVSQGIKMLLWCALAYFFLQIVPAGGLRLSKKLWILLGGLILAPLVSTLSFSVWGYRWVADAGFDLYQSALERFGFTILPFALFSALAVLIAAVVLSRHEALEQERKLSALREVYYTGLKQEQMGLRTLRHDLRNHVTAVQGLMEQGKEAEALRYLAALADSPALEGGKRYAANETANVVLCSKAAQMEAPALVPDFTVSLPKALALSDIDLCALLGNALDNAIEGAAGAENNTITLRCRLDKGMFILQVQNAISGEVNADFSTTKADNHQHGYGLAGMREIATHHGGSLEAAAKDGHFTLLICFPCGER